MDLGPVESRKDPAVSCAVSRMSLRTSMALLLAAASFVFVAAYTYGHVSFKGENEDLLCPLEGKVAHAGGEEKAVAVPPGPGDHQDKTEEDGEQEEQQGGAGNAPGSTTGQRVAGHLLAVLLLASVTAAIVEAVRARMTRSASAKASDQAGPGVSEAHHHGSNTGTRPSRRGTLQEKSYSYDGYIYRSRSSSAGVGNQQLDGGSVSTASAASRAQKAMRVRLGGKTGATPPLLRRSSFPVMSRTLTRGDSNGGSPATGSRKPSISDIGDDDLGELQKKRVRLIRRF